jgi:GNAT superfamily N-acetyltransferase
LSIAAKALDIRFEPPNDKDEALIMSSWLRSYRNSATGRQVSLDSQYFAWQHALASALVRRGTTIVARPGSWDEGIVGWVCGERRGDRAVLHYVYVKQAYRKAGMGLALCEALTNALDSPSGPVIYTHDRRPYSQAARKRGWLFDVRYLGVGR